MNSLYIFWIRKKLTLIIYKFIEKSNNKKLITKILYVTLSKKSIDHKGKKEVRN